MKLTRRVAASALIAGLAATGLTACDSDGNYADPIYNEICVDSYDRRVVDYQCDAQVPSYEWWYLPAGTFVGIGQRVTTGNQQRPARVRRAPTTTTVTKTTTARSTATTAKTTTPKTTRKATPTRTRSTR
ncbi:hypothetical protein SEA_BARB_82 [Gordonia phage Barb]|uniref:Lipoprotein n=1 Tax=Gordonia phage Barb TaxID=2588128 RepID=A0A4Y5TZ98_9CAUD|nr:hypothetical protein KNU55_gp82 [Gordonia phage Barb]QDB74758.1 hypothetical protein SEA_BARB_82 [Gordonia phage Barb]QXO14461.1 hypothetical protein SEA_FUGAX_83 [Gordonia phage Fugax]WNM73196.1 hypothetical protein SEA_CLAMCHOWDER_82 [Gordonia phage ClamChowder]